MINMPICVVCQGDGVLVAVGAWYCIDHAHVGFIATAKTVAHIYGSDEDTAANRAADLVNELWKDKQ